MCQLHFPEFPSCLSILLDISPLDFLFQSPSIPIFSQTTKSFGDTPFQKYQLTLKRQLIGRSAQLDDILSALEHCARTIQHDFSIVKAGIGSDEKTKFVSIFKPLYLFFTMFIGRLLIINLYKPINLPPILFQPTLYLSSTKWCQILLTIRLVRCYYLLSTLG